MSEALEKIRAQHQPKHPHMGGGGSGGCRGCHGQTSEPCDVVRLAEAVDALREGLDEYWITTREGRAVVDAAERTLREVAGIVDVAHPEGVESGGS